MNKNFIQRVMEDFDVITSEQWPKRSEEENTEDRFERGHFKSKHTCSCMCREMSREGKLKVIFPVNTKYKTKEQS